MRFTVTFLLFIMIISKTKSDKCEIASDKWKLIFCARAGNGEKVMPAFLGSHTKCPSSGRSCRIQDGCFQDVINPTSVLLLKREPKNHMRSRIIDYWVNANIRMVKVALFKDGQEVAYVIFNGVGSNKENWFDKSRLMESSWCDITTGAYFNIFSIKGFHGERTFHINRKYGGCPNDIGWLIISEGRVWCNFDRHKNYPQFLYAQSGAATRWKLKKYQKADVFAIFIVRDI